MKKVQIDKLNDLATIEKQILATRPKKFKSFIANVGPQNTILSLRDEWGYFRKISPCEEKKSYLIYRS